jgi:hypothetical protein
LMLKNPPQFPIVKIKKRIINNTVKNKYRP